LRFFRKHLSPNAPYSALQLDRQAIDRNPAGSFSSGDMIQRFWRFEGGDVESSGAAKTQPDALESNLGTTTGAIDLDSARRRLEAILVVSREPISSRKLAQLADLADATQARTLARQLNERYDSEKHAFRIEEVAGGFMMLTRPQFARWLRKIDGLRAEEYQPQSALETLAIVAYRQPVPRANIEAVRGVGCDDVLRQLMQRDLVRICGRSEELGRPYLYGTTKRFLQLFGLKSLERLPRSDWIRQAELQFAEPAKQEVPPSVTDATNS
jgi:segregation and condensation protein B